MTSMLNSKDEVGEAFTVKANFETREVCNLF